MQEEKKMDSYTFIDYLVSIGIKPIGAVLVNETFPLQESKYRFKRLTERSPDRGETPQQVVAKRWRALQEAHCRQMIEVGKAPNDEDISML